jgi:hypothetical protein
MGKIVDMNEMLKSTKEEVNLIEEIFIAFLGANPMKPF